MKSKATAADAYKLIHDGILAFARAERYGIRIDVAYCEKKTKHLARRIKLMQTEIEKTTFYKRWKHVYGAKTNIHSGHQLSNLLYKNMKLKPTKQTTSGGGSTDEEALRQFKIPALDLIMQVKKLEKVKDTYLGAFIREQSGGIMHPFFNLHTVRTYRSSSSDPNFQNIPKRDVESMRICRKAILPRQGHMLLEADFSSLEVNISACVTKDTKIKTIDGLIPIRNLIWKIKQGIDVFVYGYDFEKQRIGISKVTDGGKTRKKVEVWKVLLDNGKTITATPNHKFLLRNKEYKLLKDLQPGDSLMPLYESNVRTKHGVNYRKIRLNNGMEQMMAHNLIALDVLGTKISGSNKIVHHIDSNGCNNSLNNLQIMTRKEHMKIHSIQGWINNRKGHIKNHWMKTEEGKQFAKEMQAKRKIEWTEEDWEAFGQKLSKTIIKRGGHKGEKNPMYGKKQSQDTKRKISAAKKGTPRSLEAIEKHRKALTGRKRPSFSKQWKKRISEGLKGRKLSKEHKEKLSEVQKGKKFSLVHRKALSENKKKYWEERKDNNDKVICKICGKQFITISNTHLLHKHGISIDVYKEQYNHKVVSIEFYGYEDTYNINVERFHNFAVDAGVIIKNCYHKDPTMIHYLNDKKSDMHLDMAKQIYKFDTLDRRTTSGELIRFSAKSGFVFPQFYGDYYGNNASALCDYVKLPQGRWKEGQGIQLHDNTYISDHLIEKGIKSYSQFTEHLKGVEEDFWNNRFKVYNNWRKDWIQKYRETGYLKMLTGFTCSGVMRDNEITNYPIQGAAFHCLLFTFIEVDKIMRKEKWKSKLIGQIHDSIIMDVLPEELEHVKEVIHKIVREDLPKKWGWIIVPLEIDIDVYAINAPWVH